MKNMKKLLSVLLVIVMVFALMGSALAADTETSTAAPAVTTAAAATGEMAGQIVILHTNDVHGKISGYAKIAAMKAAYEAKGAYVLLLDAGDYSQGTVYVSTSKGASAVELMNLAGYDAAALGNHEFDYGYEQLKSNLSTAKFAVLAANVKYNGKTAFADNKVFTAPDGTKIGVFGLDTPETATKANPAMIKGITFGTDAELVTTAAAQVKALRDLGCKYVVCLGHLGVDAESVGHQSLDVLKAVSGIDLFIDGHSHSVIEGNTNTLVSGETRTKLDAGSTMLVSTGTAFANIGVVTISGGKMSASLVPVTDDMAADSTVKAKSDELTKTIDAAYGAKFAATQVYLNGVKANVRTQETNMGDLITDALVWKSEKEGVKVDAAVTNGGGIRAEIKAGDITKKDINTVLPFGNTLSIVKVTGAELLEALEASTYSTPDAIGGFPQVSGIKFTIDTTKTFAAGDKYPGSTYAKPASINRVSIQSVGGKAFDAAATYTIVTNNFTAAGGDTYYAFAASPINYDLGIPMDEAVMEYITTALKGTVTAAKYGSTQGRITILCKACKTFSDVTHGAWYENSVLYCLNNSLMGGSGANTFAPSVSMNRGMFVTMLYRLAGSPEVTVGTTFTDVPANAYYAKAVAWAVSKNITTGVTATTFQPGKTMTRQEMASFIYRYYNSPAVTGTLTYSDASSVSSWAVSAVNYCTAQSLMTGEGTTFNASGSASRAMGATVLTRMHQAAAAAAAPATATNTPAK
jgi:2',3'-cyclic-nucleotide 2'-phosphodiesterase (5'-nucleotidase family)